MTCEVKTLAGASQPQPVANKINTRNIMLYTIAVVLVILWLLGLVSSYTMGGFIHILLVVALVIILVNFLSGRKRVV